jgi:hypothetical protein
MPDGRRLKPGADRLAMPALGWVGAPNRTRFAGKPPSLHWMDLAETRRTPQEGGFRCRELRRSAQGKLACAVKFGLLMQSRPRSKQALKIAKRRYHSLMASRSHPHPLAPPCPFWVAKARIWRCHAFSFLAQSSSACQMVGLLTALFCIKKRKSLLRKITLSVSDKVVGNI